MIMTVDELRRFVSTDEDDQALEDKLQALESLIRAYTNNNFLNRAIRSVALAVADDSAFVCTDTIPLSVGDTIQVSESDMMQGDLFTITAISGKTITVNGRVYTEADVTITKVEYPLDIRIGIVNMMKWELMNREKVGVQSETISRHSVTYFNMDGDNSIMGYPKSMLGFLKPYMKARFGQGLCV